MIQFLEYCNQNPNQNGITLLFQIVLSNWNQSLREESHTKFLLNNLEWYLSVTIFLDKIGIDLSCLSDTLNTWYCRINSTLSYKDKYKRCRSTIQNQEQIIDTKKKSTRLLQHLTIESTYLNQGLIHCALSINAHSHYDHSEECETLRVICADLQRKLTNYEKQKQHIDMFSEVLSLFEAKSCCRFERELQLSDDVKVHLQMVPVEINHVERNDKKNDRKVKR